MAEKSHKPPLRPFLGTQTQSERVATLVSGMEAANILNTNRSEKIGLKMFGSCSDFQVVR